VNRHLTALRYMGADAIVRRSFTVTLADRRDASHMQFCMRAPLTGPNTPRQLAINRRLLAGIGLSPEEYATLSE
jgi:hypothetical protein